MKPIKFGTDGWRAVIADDYTFARVWAVASGYAQWLLDQGERRPILVSYDARFLSETFAAVTAAVLAGRGLEVSLSAHPAITPAASYWVARNGLGGAAIITASHNPAEWNGFKIKTPDGASAPPEVTQPVQANANRLIDEGVPAEYDVSAPPTVPVVDLREPYVARLTELCNADLIRQSELSIVVDDMYGAGIGYLGPLLRRLNCEVREVRAERNPTFGGVNPEPIEQNLGESLPLTKERGVDVGFALDGDGDRLGIMADGEYVNTHRMMALLALHSLKNRGERGALVRTVNMTSAIDALAAHFDVPMIETPVGFKNIAQLMLERDVTIGGEESGGTGFSGHIPERDACLAALRICEFMATENKSVSELLQLLWSYVGGEHFFARIDVHLSDEQKQKVLSELASPPATIAGRKVESLNILDGWKFFFTGGDWLLIRASGTEPLIRIYGEAKSQDQLDALLAAGKALVDAT